MNKTSATATKRTSKISQPKTRQTMGRPSKTPVKIIRSGTSQRKVSTPTDDKSMRTVSPDVSVIKPTTISSGPSKQGKPIPKPVSKTVTGSNRKTLTDLLDVEYTRYLQTMFRKKLAEAEASDVDDKLMMLQKRIAENQNILEKTTTRLKNINFNKEVETLHKLRNPYYGQVLETLDNANCEEYLETINKKMEQSQNQLRMKNIELPQGGSSELLQIMKDTLAACENLRANNNLEVPKVLTEIKTSNHRTSETLSRCLELIPEVEDLILDKAMLEICANNNE